MVDAVLTDAQKRDAVANGLAHAKRTLVWPEWLVAETAAERWLKTKCEKRATQRRR